MTTINDGSYCQTIKQSNKLIDYTQKALTLISTWSQATFTSKLQKWTRILGTF